MPPQLAASLVLSGCSIFLPVSKRPHLYGRLAPQFRLHSVQTCADGADCQAQAEPAVRVAVATTGPERLKWVQIALAWSDLGTARARLSAAYAPKESDSPVSFPVSA